MDATTTWRGERSSGDGTRGARTGPERTSAERTVGERMTRGAIVVRADQPLADAARLLDEHRIHGLPAVDDAGALVGVISATDMLRARTTEHLWSAWPGLRVRHLMSAPALTIGADASLEEAAVRMEQQQVHRLVVVAPDGVTPVGVISTSDIVRAMAAEAGAIAEVGATATEGER